MRWLLPVTLFLAVNGPGSAQPPPAPGPRPVRSGAEPAGGLRAPLRVLRIRLDPGSPRVSGPARAWMMDPATGARLGIVTVYPDGTADIPVMARAKEGGNGDGGDCEDERFKYKPLPPDPAPPWPQLPEEDIKLKVPKPADVCGSAVSWVDRGVASPTRLVPFGGGLRRGPIRNVGVGLGGRPPGATLLVSRDADGVVTGRLDRAPPSGSRITLRDAAGTVLATGAVGADGSVRFSPPRVALDQVASTCRESPGAAPLCSEPGEFRKAITKAGNNGGL